MSLPSFSLAIKSDALRSSLGHPAFILILCVLGSLGWCLGWSVWEGSGSRSKEPEVSHKGVRKRKC